MIDRLLTNTVNSMAVVLVRGGKFGDRQTQSEGKAKWSQRQTEKEMRDQRHLVMLLQEPPKAMKDPQFFNRSSVLLKL
jgi:hypothetical protein